MATRLLERVPTERIAQQAEPVDLGRVLVTALVGVLYLVGWLAGKTVTLLGVALGWALAAVRTGWHDGRGAAAEEQRRARAA